jgi:hypothetical protein
VQHLVLLKVVEEHTKCCVGGSVHECAREGVEEWALEGIEESER